MRFWIFLGGLALVGVAVTALARWIHNSFGQEPYLPDPRYGTMREGRIVDVHRESYIRGMEQPHARYDPVPSEIAARRAAHARRAVSGEMDDIRTPSEVVAEQAALREERLRLGLDPVTGRPVRQGPAMRVAAGKAIAGRRTCS